MDQKTTVIKMMFLALAVAGLFGLFRVLHIQEWLRTALGWIEGLGVWGPVVFIVIYVLACVFFVPGSILTLGAGVLFGVVKGSVLVSIASTVGATGAFVVGRYFARGWVSRKIEGNLKFRAIDDAVGQEGWKIVGLTRLSPVFPFNLLNYAYGLTRVPLRDYFFASWIGMMPGTVMYVYIGSLTADLASLGATGRERTMGEWILYVLGLIATIVVTIYVTKVAKTALDRSLKPKG